MKIATWNVNSLRVRIGHVTDWLEATGCDILCMQETKTVDEQFPQDIFWNLGYDVLFSGQKTYNGTAIAWRRGTVSNPRSVERALPGFADEQKRFLAATFATPIGDLRVLNGYFPNGQEVGCEKYAYKLAWLEALATALEGEKALCSTLILLGDFNIAPQDRDVWDPKGWAGKIICSEPERAAFARLLSCGLTDAFRLFEQPEKSFSWWDYRMMGFRRNHGLRIDHMLVTESLARRIASVSIDRAPRALEKPSDHAPVVAEIG